MIQNIPILAKFEKHGKWNKRGFHVLKKTCIDPICVVRLEATSLLETIIKGTSLTTKLL
jgi:hypothetical protein